jgi:hypothetical protein
MTFDASPSPGYWLDLSSEIINNAYNKNLFS